MFLFNDAFLFTVIWRQTYGKEPLVMDCGSWSVILDCISLQWIVIVHNGLWWLTN